MALDTSWSIFVLRGDADRTFCKELMLCNIKILDVMTASKLLPKFDILVHHRTHVSEFLYTQFCTSATMLHLLWIDCEIDKRSGEPGLEPAVEQTRTDAAK